MSEFYLNFWENSWPWLFLSILFVCFLVLAFLTTKKLRTRQALLFPSYEPIEPRHLNIPGFRICYLEAGQGPTLLLLHGLGASSYTWRYLIPKLAQHYRVLAPDLPGFGKSDKPVDKTYGLDEQAERIEAFLDQLNIKSCYVAGSSLGASLALWLSLKRPQRFFKVAALAPPLWRWVLPVFSKPWLWLSTPARFVVHKPLIRYMMSRALFNPALIHPQSIEAYSQPYVQQPLAIRTFLLATQALCDKRLHMQLHQLQVPFLILWGTKDKVTPYKEHNILTQIIPQNTQIQTHSECGHHPQEDNPDWVYNQLRAFFN